MFFSPKCTVFILILNCTTIMSHILQSMSFIFNIFYRPYYPFGYFILFYDLVYVCCMWRFQASVFKTRFHVSLNFLLGINKVLINLSIYLSVLQRSARAAGTTTRRRPVATRCTCGRRTTGRPWTLARRSTARWPPSSQMRSCNSSLRSTWSLMTRSASRLEISASECPEMYLMTVEFAISCVCLTSVYVWILAEVSSWIHKEPVTGTKFKVLFFGNNRSYHLRRVT